MRQIIEEPVNEGKLYLIYTCEPDLKKMVVFKPVEDNKYVFVSTTTSATDLYNNRSVYDVNLPHDVYDAKDVTLFKSLHLKGSAIFQLDDDEANLILAEVV